MVTIHSLQLQKRMHWPGISGWPFGVRSERSRTWGANGEPSLGRGRRREWIGEPVGDVHGMATKVKEAVGSPRVR